MSTVADLVSADPSLAPATRLAHFGDDEARLCGAVAPPIFATSTFVFDRTADLHAALFERPWDTPHHYARLGTPTNDLVERKIADLEGMESCRLVSGGMAAISLAVLSILEEGSHAVVVDGAYGPARELFAEYLPRFGITHDVVDGRSVEAVADAMRPETSLVYMESPTSLTFRLQDVAAIARIAREKGATTLLDNTYHTPLQMNPAALGVDVVVHSCTKYMGGHADVVAGAILFSGERMRRYVRREGNLFASAASPFAAWLVGRGLRTLKVRLDQHERAGNAVADFVAARPEVARVHHLGLPSYAQHALLSRQARGSGGLFSFEPKTQDRERIFAFCDALRLFGRGISWGGYESLVVPMPVTPIGEAERWIVRLFCGLEEPSDLIADLARAFPTLGATE